MVRVSLKDFNDIFLKSLENDYESISFMAVYFIYFIGIFIESSENDYESIFYMPIYFHKKGLLCFDK